MASDPTTVRLAGDAIARIAVVRRRASDRLDVVAAPPEAAVPSLAATRAATRRPGDRDHGGSS